jgi:hypothetical protein
MSADMYEISMGMNERVGELHSRHRCERTPTSETKIVTTQCSAEKCASLNQTRVL